MSKYTVKSVHRAASSAVKPGDTVYDLRQCDYGLASDDSRHTGVQHVSVTLEADGGYPSFTIPLEDLERVE